MALKNKLSLLCLGIIATNFIVNNNASAMNDFYNNYSNNKPLYNYNSLPIFNKPYAEDITKPLPFGQFRNKWNSYSSNSDSYNSSDSTDSDIKPGYFYKPKYYNKGQNGWQNKLNNPSNVFRPVNYNINNTLLTSNSILTNCLASRNWPTNESHDYETRLIDQLKNIMHKNCATNLKQITEMFPNISRDYLVYVVKQTLSSFYLSDHQMLEQLDRFLTDNTMSYLQQNSSDNSSECFGKVLEHDFEYFNNKQSVIALKNLISKLYSNDVFTLILNQFIGKMPTALRKEFNDVIVEDIYKVNIPQLKLYMTELVASVIINDLVTQTNNSNSLEPSEFLQFFSKASDQLSFLKEKNAIAPELDNVIAVINNIIARQLNAIGTKYSNVSVTKLLEQNSPEPLFMALMQLYCKCVQKNQLSQYSNNVYQLLTNKKLFQQMRNMTLVSWSKYNGLLDRTNFPKWYGNVNSIESVDLINLVNLLIDQANSNSPKIAQQANNYINHILNYSSITGSYNSRIKDGDNLLLSTMVYWISKDQTIKQSYTEFNKFLEENGYGRMPVTYHTTAKQNIVHVTGNNNTAYDLSWVERLLQTPQLLTNDIHINKSEWNTNRNQSNDILHRLSVASQSNPLNQDLKLEVQRSTIRKQIYMAIQRQFSQQLQTSSSDFVLSRRVLQNVVSDLITSNRVPNKNAPVRVAIDNVVANASYADLWNILDKYKSVRLTYPQVNNSDVIAMLALDVVIDNIFRSYKTCDFDFRELVINCNAQHNHIPFGTSNYNNLVTSIEQQLNQNTIVRKYVNAVRANIDNSLLNDNITSLLSKYLQYNFLFYLNDPTVQRIYFDLWKSKVPSNYHYHNNIDTFKKKVLDKIINTNQFYACLEYLGSSNTQFGRVINYDIYPYVLKQQVTTNNAPAEQYLNTITRNNALLAFLKDTAVTLQNHTVYQTRYVGPLKQYAQEYQTSINRRLQQNISNQNLAKVVVNKIETIFEKLLQKDSNLSSSNSILHFLSKLRSNKNGVIACITNSLGADQKNGSTNGIKSKMNDLFEVYFLIERILKRETVDDMADLLSETDLNIAKMTNNYLIPAFFNGHTAIVDNDPAFYKQILSSLWRLFNNNNAQHHISSAHTVLSAHDFINI